MIDTHCHIYKEYYKNIDEILLKAKKNGINNIINNGINYESNIECLEFKKKYPNCYIALGFQPEELKAGDEKKLNIIEDNIEKIIAIGEIGLDYYYSKDNKEYQIKMFEKQIEIALKYNLPIIVHSRKAFDDTYKILKKYKGIKGIIHCFSGTIEQANKYIELGFMLGIGGVLTFKNSNLQNIVKEIDLNNVVLETDSPYLTPEPYRGLPNEPANIKIICEKISEIKKISVNEVEKIINNNVSNLFNIE